MACVEDNMRPAHADSEREEGEIVDDLDELSDISSEEEYLLRQRLQVLENYNNVLERKEAKRTSICLGNTKKVAEALDLSDVSVTNFDESIFSPGDSKVSKSKCIHHKHRRRKDAESNLKYKDHKKKPHKTKKRIEPLKVISETSDEEDYEYRNKRRKLANAVLVNKVKADTSLRSRLTKMIANSESYISLEHRSEQEYNQTVNSKEVAPEHGLALVLDDNANDNKTPQEIDTERSKEKAELINISTDDDVEIISTTETNINAKTERATGIEENKEIKSEEASDEDLEILRQHALKSKAAKIQEPEQKSIEETESNPLISEDDDDDAELRLICLRSAFLKKAIEHKQKQKLEKKLSQSTSLYDEIIADDMGLSDVDNNTDIESMDMDMGSDNENKDHVANANANFKDILGSKTISENHIPEETVVSKKDSAISKNKNIPKDNSAPKEEDIDEDEDLLRAKLLTSLSKNLPLLVETSSSSSPKVVKLNEKDTPSPKELEKVVEEKKFIINTGGSDSEGEHEATRNLTKMHMKLSEQIDFQQKLDMFLKSARSEVEKTQLPDVVQQPSILPLPKTPQKFVPKAVNHLPKSEQIEYKNLVKRMAELEKIKQARQAPLPAANQLKPALNVKDTLKPRNVSIDKTNLQQINNLDEQIALSRKKIAEESAKVLQLREQETKLSQKYKIVATELRNLTTAVSLNKRQQKSAQMRLTKMRGQHQLLLKRLTIYSKTSANNMRRQVNKTLPIPKLQKENAPLERDLKSVKVSVVNDFKERKSLENSEPTLSVQIDVSNNRKTVTLEDEELNRICEDIARSASRDEPHADDYKSPLDALSSAGYKSNHDERKYACSSYHISRHRKRYHGVDHRVRTRIADSTCDLERRSQRRPLPLRSGWELQGRKLQIPPS